MLRTEDLRGPIVNGMTGPACHPAIRPALHCPRLSAPGLALPSRDTPFGTASPPQSSSDPAKDLSEFRVLIVEDEWFIAMESEAVLQAGGYSVVGIAGTADDAVALAGRERPDIVLMDIRLRGARDGIDAALDIRDKFDIPCIFATAHTEPHMRERGAAAQPRAWLIKPFSDQQLLRAVRTALARLD